MTNPIAGLTAPVQLPVNVSVGGVFAQSGVTMWVSPQLSVAAPSTTTMLQLEPYTSGNAVVATLGTSTYTYALTSGVLPAGLTLVHSGGSPGQITGTPAANTAGTYLVTVTATDSSSPALTGSVSFAIVVNGGLYVTSSAGGPFTSTFGSAGAGLPTISAVGGDGTYNWAVTTSNPAVCADRYVGSGWGVCRHWRDRGRDLSGHCHRKRYIDAIASDGFRFIH